jgi:hypothetical protein
MKGAMIHGHQHAEAFCLMQYECSPPRTTRFGPGTPRPSCGTVEWIWNSRDGVTPFGVNCRACGGEAMHARWGEDQYAPDYTPPLGSRMFVDLTPEAAREHALANARRFWDDPTYPASQTGRWDSVEAMADDLARAYVTPGAPDLVVVAG